MANCFLPLGTNTMANSDNHKKVAKLKTDYSTLLLAKKLLTRFSCFSKKSSNDVPMSSLLKKLAKGYDSHPTSSPAAAKSSASADKKQSVKRIKVVITKQQLQELLSKQIQIEDVLSSGGTPTPTPTPTPTTLLSLIKSEDDSTHVPWKPKLKSIPEENEL